MVCEKQRENQNIRRRFEDCDPTLRKLTIRPQQNTNLQSRVESPRHDAKDNASQVAVEKAAKDAQIHDFILSLPDGYATTVGERGLKLSGGEKQRVGIARTLLKNPPILLLDEATSALDTETEREIREALTNASKGRSVLTIAHRLSTIADADRIIVLENGSIVEIGTHEALLRKRGRYHSLWTKQLTEDNPAA